MKCITTKNAAAGCNKLPIPKTYKEIKVPKNLPAMKYDEAQLRDIFRYHDINGDGAA